jgi:hypothetical protein
MRAALRGRPARGVVCLVPARWCPVAVAKAIAGLPGRWRHALPSGRPRQAWGPPARCRGGTLAYTP